MKTTIFTSLLSLLIGAMLTAVEGQTSGGGGGGGGAAGSSSSSGSSSASGARPVTPPSQTLPPGLNDREQQPPGLQNREQLPPELQKRLDATNNFSVNATNTFTATNEVGMNTNQMQGTNALTPTGAVSGTNQMNSNIAIRDHTVTDNDKSLLIAVRQSVQNQLGITTPAAMPVHFFINNGVVTLIGSVPTADESQRILLLVRQTPGVVQVVDRLQVGTTSGVVQPRGNFLNATRRDTAVTVADQALLTTVRQQAATQLGMNVSQGTPLPLHFSINNGVVGVYGPVQTTAQKQAIIGTIQRTPGVTRVVDGMQVSATGGADVAPNQFPGANPTINSNLPAPTRDLNP
jgi:hypothetical protein